jgi:hypothetical protein
MDTETKSKAFGYLSMTMNVIYRLTIIAALLWIGYSLQSIVITLNTPVEDSCTADQSSDGQNGDDSRSQIIKPLLRGQL